MKRIDIPNITAGPTNDELWRTTVGNDLISGSEALQAIRTLCDTIDYAIAITSDAAGMQKDWHALDSEQAAFNYNYPIMVSGDSEFVSSEPKE